MQTGMRLLKVGHRDYQGVVLDMAEQASLLQDLGAAFNWMHRLELACRSRLAAMACNTPLVPVPDAVLQATCNNYQRGTRRPYGLMEWPGLLRKLDRIAPSYRT
jgi:hypothetical protein